MLLLLTTRSRYEVVLKGILTVIYTKKTKNAEV